MSSSNKVPVCTGSLEAVTVAGAVLGSLARTLEEVEALALEPPRALDAAEEFPVSSRGLCIHGAQAAKLYGFTERFLTTRVDPLQPEHLVPHPIAADGAVAARDTIQGGAEERIAGVRRARKELVRRCNALLDAFERAKSSSTAAEVVMRRPHQDADSLVLSLSLEDDLVAMVLTLRSGQLIRPASLSLPAENKDVGTLVSASLQLLSASGFLEGGVGAGEHKALPHIVVSSAEPYAESVASATARLASLLVGRSVVHCHAHIAAVAAMAHCYLPALPLFHVLVLTATVQGLQYSLMRYTSDGSPAASCAIDCISHGQLQCVGAPPHQHGTDDAAPGVSALSFGPKWRRGGAYERNSALIAAPATIRRQIEDAGMGAWLTDLNAVCFASIGSAALAAFLSLRLPLEKAFPNVPVLTGFPDSGMCYAVTAPRDTEVPLRALTVEDGVVAFGASLLARPGLYPRCLTQPLGTLIGIKSNLVRQSSRWVNEGDQGAIVSVIPFFHCSSAFGSSSSRSAISLSSLARKGNHMMEIFPGDKLCLEVVEISIAGPAVDLNFASFHNSLWNSGYVCTEPPSLGKSAGSSLDVRALCMNRRLPTGLECRVLGRIPLDDSIECSVLAGSEATIAIELSLPEIGPCFEDRDKILSAMLLSVGTVGSGTSGSSSLHWLVRQVPLYSLSVRPPDASAAANHPPPADSPADDLPSSAAPDLCVEVILSCEEDANVCKSRGNSAMSGARPGASDASVALQSAVVSYSCGLQLDPLSAVLYSNRCAAQLQLAALATSNQATVSHASKLSNDDRDHLLKRALLDATASAMLRPEWSKAHSRLGETQFRLGNLQAAVDAYTRAYECELAELQQASPSTVESMKNRGMGHSSILRSLNEAMAALEAEKKQREQEDLRSESSKRQRKQGAATAGDGGAAKGSSCIVS